MATKNNVTAIDVWEQNLEEQFFFINSLVDQFPYIAIDTAFPGVLIPHPRRLSPVYGLYAAFETYHYMKSNVKNTKLIQLGITLSDAKGNLPRFANSSCIWEFNFCDFDVEVDHGNPSSIQLLKDQGIDFKKNKEKGISSTRFAHLLRESKLMSDCWTPHGYIPIKKVTWVTFNSPYDFGYLIKVLIQRDLPDDLFMFLELVSYYFGVSVYDVKRIANGWKLFGGLDRIAKTLQVDRVAGKHHQAGSDSLLTLQTFMKMKEKDLLGVQVMDKFRFIISGLEVI